ncbi:conjugal transfer protein TraD [Empedobacter brevis]|uniref:conjugal transfer protein TraD n=1 Tax=Empedobacter brevis TaxID=247 RepID=UPI002899CE53|nr:conjugal transfer protein TraD [Empedobacter brevis]
MEILILICLMIVIALLIYDKLPLQRTQSSKDEKNSINLPDIIGESKQIRNLQMSNTSNERQVEVGIINPHNLDIELDENEIIPHQNSKEELDEDSSNVPDFEEEEEEWKRYGIRINNDGFAQGVTFEELSQVERFLEKNEKELSKIDTTVTIVQKINGTELFSLLEDSIENATSNIAKLLDSSISSESNSNSSILKKSLDDFDIGEFV